MRDSRKVPHVHSELIKAWAEGEQIEWLDDTGVWRDANTPQWFADTAYRIKVKPKEDVVQDVRVFLNIDNLVLIRCNSETRRADRANLRLVFDGETYKLKYAEVI